MQFSQTPPPRRRRARTYTDPRVYTSPLRNQNTPQPPSDAATPTQTHPSVLARAPRRSGSPQARLRVKTDSSPRARTILSTSQSTRPDRSPPSSYIVAIDDELRDPYPGDALFIDRIPSSVRLARSRAIRAASGVMNDAPPRSSFLLYKMPAFVRSFVRSRTRRARHTAIRHTPSRHARVNK
jgi:hypothetical protein